MRDGTDTAENFLVLERCFVLEGGTSPIVHCSQMLDERKGSLCWDICLCECLSNIEADKAIVFVRNIREQKVKK